MVSVFHVFQPTACYSWSENTREMCTRVPWLWFRDKAWVSGDFLSVSGFVKQSVHSSVIHSFTRVFHRYQWHVIPWKWAEFLFVGPTVECSLTGKPPATLGSLWPDDLLETRNTGLQRSSESNQCGFRHLNKKSCESQVPRTKLLDSVTLSHPWSIWPPPAPVYFSVYFSLKLD